MTEKKNNHTNGDEAYLSIPIPIENIDTEGQSVREVMDDDHVVELSMSIAKHGLLEPIVVRQKEQNRYQLEAGLHRLAACARLKKTHIPANIRQCDTVPLKAIALIENVCRRDMSLKEEVDAVYHLHNGENLSPSQIAELTGKSREWVDRRITAREYPADIATELYDKNIGLAQADELSRIQDYTMRRQATNNAIQSKLTAQQTRDLVSVFLQTPALKDAIAKGTKEVEEILAATPPIPCQTQCGADLRTTPHVLMKVCENCHKAILEAIEHYGTCSRDAVNTP